MTSYRLQLTKINSSLDVLHIILLKYDGILSFPVFIETIKVLKKNDTVLLVDRKVVVVSQ